MLLKNEDILYQWPYEKIKEDKGGKGDVHK